MATPMYNRPVCKTGNGCLRRANTRRSSHLNRQQNRLHRTQCSICDSALMHTVLPGFRCEIKEHISKDNILEALRDVFRTVNALMNDSGGLVCLHFRQMCSLSLLDQVVDKRIGELIANNSTYEENFERQVLDDSHVLYRVKPADYPCISVLAFNSPVSTNRGLAEPSQSQMQAMMKWQNNQANPAGHGADTTEDTPASQFALEEGQLVDLKPSCVVFLHSISQGQGVAADENIASDLLNYWWGDLKLPRYISALLKHQRGGSVLLGIAEEKCNPSKAWELVENLDLSAVLQTELKIWKDKEPEDDRRVFYLAAGKNVPDSEEKPTGRYICQGVVLPEKERHDFETRLYEKIETDMLWFPCYPADSPPVKVCYHPVRAGHPDQCVVEVKVTNKFAGVVFHDRNGPEMYKIKMSHGQPHIASLSFYEYSQILRERFSNFQIMV